MYYSETNKYLLSVHVLLEFTLEFVSQYRIS